MNEDQKTPPNYQWLKTDDGSFTLFSERFQESCHSSAGASSETQFHYIEGCGIKEAYQCSDCFTLLEIGFGTGLGIDQTLQVLNTLPHRPCKLISTEIDKTLVEFLVKEPPFNFFKGLQFKEDHFYSCDEYRREIIILIGNARETVPAYFEKQNLKVDAIYQDAFSPRKNPELWTVEWFTDLKKISKPTAKLSTYSSSSSIRKSMIEGGWNVYNGPKFGPKRSSTRASLQGESELEVIERLQRSPALPLTDATAENYKSGNPKL